MSHGIKRKLERVRLGIEAQLARERDDGNRFARAMQREGFVGGYLQALNDVRAALDGFTDCNSRFAGLWGDDA